MTIGKPTHLFSGDDLGTRFSLRRFVESFRGVTPDGNHFIVIRGVRQGTNEVVLATQLAFRGMETGVINIPYN